MGERTVWDNGHSHEPRDIQEEPEGNWTGSRGRMVRVRYQNEGLESRPHRALGLSYAIPLRCSSSITARRKSVNKDMAQLTVSGELVGRDRIGVCQPPKLLDMNNFTSIAQAPYTIRGRAYLHVDRCPRREWLDII